MVIWKSGSSTKKILAAVPTKITKDSDAAKGIDALAN